MKHVFAAALSALVISTASIAFAQSMSGVSVGGDRQKKAGCTDYCQLIPDWQFFRLAPAAFAQIGLCSFQAILTSSMSAILSWSR
ncbi:hypothetical protein HFO93_20310 [Rhizobium leguminosarum]|uniref:hypothetical protein n=1 Tax=Rhizobium leguminosarum TaxID=384 RepID=UPI001C987ECF|nr:hypothetical protein [Rhizobium leguminosarum]MBY5445783.1 hypothetical protein [Rhizobium leguminosarum]